MTARIRWLVDAIGRQPAWPLLVAAWTLALLYAFPGHLSTDSVDQLYQARGLPRWDELAGGELTGRDDWHPPAMSVVWWLIERVVTGPVGMLALQLGLLVVGCYQLGRRWLRPGPAALIAAVVVLWPPVLTPMGVIWKDSQMAGFLLAGFVLALSPRRHHWVLAVICLTLGAAMRHNAALALAPLALVVARTWFPASPRRWWALGLVGTVAIAGVAALGNRALTERETHPWHSSLAIFDIAGTIRRAGPLTDDQVRALVRGAPLVATQDLQAVTRRTINQWGWWWLTHGDDRLFDPPRTAADRDAVTAAWSRAVREQPAAWLRHRALVWGVLIGVSPRLKGPVVRQFADNELQLRTLRHDATHSSLQRALGVGLDGLARTPLFWPWLYLLLALGLLVRATRRPEVVALLASGLAYEVGLFLVAPSADFRYSHWLIACTVLAAVVTLAARVVDWRGPVTADPAGCHRG